MKVVKILNTSASIYEERNGQYGDAYKKHGHIIKALFPDGIQTSEAIDFTRINLLNAIVSKLSRYASAFDGNRNDDDLRDLICYAAMLQEIDDEKFNDSNP